MKIFVAAATIGITLGAATLAFAQPPAGPMQAVRAACAGDFAKLCPNAQTRDDRRQCMMDNHEKFSDTCKAAIADMRSKMQMQAAPPPATPPTPGDRP